MEIDAKIAYEIALQKINELNRQLIELSACLIMKDEEIQQLKEQLEKGK